MVRECEHLPCWQSSRALVNAVYVLTRMRCFSKEIGLNQSLRSNSVSILSGIMEGFERSSALEFIQCLYTARGAAARVVAQLYVARDQGYISQKDFERVAHLVEETITHITNLIRHLKSSRLKASEINA